MENFEIIDIKRIKHNSYYSGLLQNLYAGSESSISLLLQLLYDANILSCFSRDIAKTFFEFSQDEIHNQYILSQCILMVGGDPLFLNSQNKWFSGRNVDYVKDIRQIIILLIENIEKIILDLKLTISKIDDFQLKKHLTTVLRNEKEHLEKINEMKNTYIK